MIEETVLDKLNKVEFLTTLELQQANFFDLALYLQELNSVGAVCDTVFKKIEEETEEKKVGDSNE